MKKNRRKPGTVQPGKVPVLDRKGHVRGHLSPVGGTSVSAARFTHEHGAVLGKVKVQGQSRTSWHFPK
jgi:hypothetical protein